MRRCKHVIVAERLTKRINSGDYTVNGFPSERALATDFGVTQKTIRKALQTLLDDHLLIRLPNGRLKVNNGTEDADAPLKQIAFLIPDWYSPEILLLQSSLLQLSQKLDFALRIIIYSHGDDPVIFNTVENFDATFIVSHENFPTEAVAPVLKAMQQPVFSLTSDWSDYGIPSLKLITTLYMSRILEHLASLGHKRIDCLKVQPSVAIVPEFIAHWRFWLKSHELDGRLLEKKVEFGTYILPEAYNCVDQLIKHGDFDSEALICLTSKSAVGAIRAMVDNGIRPGHDIAVCTLGCIEDFPGSFDYSVPSLTSISTPDPVPALSTFIKWVQSDSDQWDGPMLITPDQATVVIRESTAPRTPNP